ncbi:MAG: sigma-54-dependent Fis family transcriptional regulator [Acidobacteria bacterium]|nr:sigma-54-dependent Fis family transcriptional regulator [Acidobacteriota bacterium]
MSAAATLAVVDDDARFAEYLQIWLRTRGYEAATYLSGDALLNDMREGHLPDVVLLDVSMPGMDGLQTLRAIRLAHPSAHVVMLSGGKTPATIVEAVRLGAADYVVKPGDPDGVGEVALEAAIRNALERLALTSEVARLRTQSEQDADGMQACWSSGRAMQAVMNMVDRVADSDISVLLRGESGVGKEVIAREIHRRSPRRANQFVKVNCAALPAELLESELFGHERGAFTGAASTRVGKFEFAQHGTIMLDEIGEMPLALQAKILHVLQDREFTKLGSNRAVEVDVRVIAATNRDLEAMMRQGTFREDLYYRLQVIEIHIPSLRDRREEIQPLIDFFLLKYADVYRRPPVRPSLVLQEALLAYDWPGNIRELENMMKRLVVLQDEAHILAELSRPRASRTAEEPSVAAPAAVAPVRVAVPATPVPAAPMAAPPVAPPVPVASATPPVAPPVARAAWPAPMEAGPGAAADGVMAPPPDEPPAAATPEEPTAINLQELARQAAMTAEKEAIQLALDRFRWNRRKAAAFLQVSYKTLLNKMKECGISESNPA